HARAHLRSHQLVGHAAAHLPVRQRGDRAGQESAVVADAGVAGPARAGAPGPPQVDSMARTPAGRAPVFRDREELDGSPMIRLRRMTGTDLSLGLRLSRAAGWNQTEADWRSFLTLQPDGCFVAEWDGTPVGTTTTTLFGSVGWIAMVLVEASVR